MLRISNFWNLFPDVRDESHESRALDGFRKFALMLRADVRVARVDDLRLARNKTPQKFNFLVINVL